MKILLTDHSQFLGFQKALIDFISQVNPDLWQQRERCFISELYNQSIPTMLADKLLSSSELVALDAIHQQNLNQAVDKDLTLLSTIFNDNQEDNDKASLLTDALQIKSLIKKYPDLKYQEVLETAYYLKFFNKLANMHQKAWREDSLVSQLPSSLAESKGPYSVLNTIDWACQDLQYVDEDGEVEELVIDDFALHTRKDEWLLFLDRYAFMPDFFIDRLSTISRLKINLEVINLSLVEGNQQLLKTFNTAYQHLQDDKKASAPSYQDMFPDAQAVRELVAKEIKANGAGLKFMTPKGWKDYNREVNEILLITLELINKKFNLGLAENIEYLATFFTPNLKEHPSFSAHYQGFYGKDNLLGIYQKHNRYNDKLQSTFFVRRAKSYFSTSAFMVRASVLKQVAHYKDRLLSDFWIKDQHSNKEFDVGYIKDPWVYIPQELPSQPVKIEKSFFAQKIDNLLLSLNCYLRQLKLTTSLDSNDD